MASKILRRFQKKVRKVNTTEESAEDFPERSELDDDTEGLSARLSGTLSFGDADVTDEDYAETTATNSDPDFLHSFESDGFEYTENLLGELKPCNMLTKQLQENWKKSRGNLIVEKLIFEVTSANVVHDSSSKYVAYTIHVIKSGSFDDNKALIVRRYTDFAKLNEKLHKYFKEEMGNVVFPKKIIRKNFTHETIAKRSRAFEQYLQHIHSIMDIRRSKVFLEFFYLRDLKAGQGLLRGGMCEDAMEMLVNALHLQQKLCSWDTEHLLFTQASISLCYQELDRLEEAQAYCEQALQTIDNQENHPLLVPLLHSNIRLSWKIAKDKRQSEAKLQQVQEAGIDVLNQPSLKEHLIKDFLE
ncbi:sorting nexin-21 isoform X1 [Carcharodon carcharias]|uniref:sorting nexin-21 isoform X1 n=1 Tax=Carcharodon carcharias TaxID=13397 RepID=UPI001B7E9549|nr:sorting nexin-21 isoform X1 [Carcharodon carcharias]XP_041060078.1 sorting nexin-21 isoform X1 [Carcharodon carcharias]